MPGRALHRAGAGSEAYLARVLEGDMPGARAIVCAALAAQTTPSAVFTGVLGPALEIVGELWSLGELSVADEHMASAITQRIAEDLLGGSGPVDGPVALLACTRADRHVLGLGAVRCALAEAGWRVVTAGPLDPRQAVAVATTLRPRLVALSVKLGWHLQDAAALVARLKALPDPPAVLVGGRAVDGEAELRWLGADRVGSDLHDAVAWSRVLPGGPAEPPTEQRKAPPQAPSLKARRAAPMPRACRGSRQRRL